jgi:hypothetical protein
MISRRNGFGKVCLQQGGSRRNHETHETHETVAISHFVEFVCSVVQLNAPNSARISSSTIAGSLRVCAISSRSSCR